jgi:hypothetical protein
MSLVLTEGLKIEEIWANLSIRPCSGHLPAVAVSNLLQTVISSLFLTFLSSVDEFKARQAGECFYSVHYTAPQRYYFDKDIKTFEDVFNSFRLIKMT